MATIIEKDSIKITVPEFGWAFNPIIADCVNPQNNRINIAVTEAGTVIGDYYSFTNADATVISRGYYENVNGSSVFVSDTNYFTGFVPISVDKGRKLRFRGLIDKNVFFAVLATGDGQTIEVNGADSQITILDLSLPENAIGVRVTTRITVPFELNIGTFESTEVSNTGIEISKIGYDKKTIVDLSGLAQLLFNRDEFYNVVEKDTILYKTIRVTFSYTTITGNEIVPIGSANVNVIWGGLQIGETFNQNRTYRFFKGYPFTVPLYLDNEPTLKVRYIRDWSNGNSVNPYNYWTAIRAYDDTGIDAALGKTVTGVESNPQYVTSGSLTTYGSSGAGLKYAQVDLGSIKDIQYVQVWRYFSDGRTFYETKTEVSADGITWVSIFDSAVSGVYQETEAGKTLRMSTLSGKYNIPVSVGTTIQVSNNIIIKVEQKDCTAYGDIYLRWLNARGEWYYYLFKQTSETTSTEMSDIVFEQFYDTVNYVNGHHAGTGQYVCKSGTKMKSLTAVFLDANMYEYVSSIATSPIIDMYDSGNWRRVKINDTDIVKSSKVLQDISIEIVLPDMITQKL